MRIEGVDDKGDSPGTVVADTALSLGGEASRTISAKDLESGLWEAGLRPAVRSATGKASGG